MEKLMNRKQSKALLAVAAVVVAVAACFLAGPSQFGGPVTVLTTDGTSMEPRFHTGDLAIVHSASSYTVGDIVAYHMTPKTLVLHRIIGRDGDRFVMKGDNNSWIDSTEPSQSQIAGRLWLHAPGFGRIVVWLRSPIAIVAFAVVAGLTLFMGDGRKKRGVERRSGSRLMNANLGARRGRAGMARKEDLLTAAIGVAILAFIAAAIAFAHPLTTTGTQEAAYRQSGSFAYSSAASSGIYDGDQVSTGQPVYLQVVRDLKVGFDYRFNSEAPHTLHGTYSLAVEMGQETGWQHSMMLVPSTAFTGDQASMTGQLPLLAVQAAMAAFQSETGIKGEQFTLTVVPTIHLQGTLAGAPFAESYTPQLPFQLSPTVLDLSKQSGQADPLHPSTAGAAPRPRLETNTLTILGFAVPVLAARIAGLIVFFLAVALAAAVWRSAGVAVEVDEPDGIEPRFSALLMNVKGEDADLCDGKTIVDVAEFDDLARAAERLSRMILHSSGAGADRYFVSDGDVVYRYATLAPVPAAQFRSQREAAG
jgi:signal peptidase I